MSHLHPGQGARRRSARLRSQIHASEVDAGLARPRSARLRPQNEDGAGVASDRRGTRLSTQIQASEGAHRATRRGKRLRPQIHSSDDVAEMASSGTSPEPPASLPDNQDMLWEILLRLPLDLHSLPRASAVSKQWRGILIDPKFLRRFYAHHRKPPLLGFFQRGGGQQGTKMFTPVLAAAPNRIPAGLFSLGQRYSYSNVLDCRHGRVLLHDRMLQELIVCDPIKHKQHHLSIPPEFHGSGFNAAVVCAASDQNNVCHSSPFKVVFVYMHSRHDYLLIIARVYSSETDTWGNSISTEAPDDTLFGPCASTLVGDALYWKAMRTGDNILEFDLGTQKLTMIKGPRGTNIYNSDYFHIVGAEDGAVGLAAVSRLKLQMWQRKLDCRGVAIWLKGKTVLLRKLFKIPSQTLIRNEWLKVVGYDEDTDVIFLASHDSVYMVQPKSMQARKLNGTGSTYHCCTFTSSYPLGAAIAGGTDGAES